MSGESNSSPTKYGLAGTKNSSADLQKIFEDQLKNIFWAEKQLTKALPKLGGAASREELKRAFKSHLEETKIQVQRLDRAFELLGKKAAAKRSEAAEALAKESEAFDLISGCEAAPIIADRKLEHYEITTYGSLKSIAGVTDMKECHGLPDDSL